MTTYLRVGMVGSRDLLKLWEKNDNDAR